MFGLEDKKKKDGKDSVFDLEKDLKNLKKRKEIREKVEQRMQVIKGFLRQGQDKEEFDQFGVLIHGYAALLKVIARFGAKG